MSDATWTGGLAETGRATIKVELCNQRDRLSAWVGLLGEAYIRRIQATATVDPSRPPLLVPPEVARALGATSSGSVRVTRADGALEDCDYIDSIAVSAFGRVGACRAIVDPRRTDVRIGLIILQELDLIEDVAGGTFVPRDPDRIVYEVE